MWCWTSSDCAVVGAAEHTYMRYVIQTAEDVLPCFLWFHSRLCLVLICWLQGGKNVMSENTRSELSKQLPCYDLYNSFCSHKQVHSCRRQRDSSALSFSHFISGQMSECGFSSVNVSVCFRKDMAYLLGSLNLPNVFFFFLPLKTG